MRFYDVSDLDNNYDLDNIIFFKENLQTSFNSKIDLLGNI